MDIKIQQLKHFLSVTEAGGFRAAAQQANRSQAALSTSIKALEDILGESLFETGHKARLTPFGELALPKIQQFLNHYTTLENELKAAAKGLLGELRIACVPSVAMQVIPNVLAQFGKYYPEVKVELIDDNALGVQTRLLAGEVDLALGQYLEMEKSSIHFTPLFADPLGVVCLKQHVLAQQAQPIHWQQLLAFPFISNGTCRLLEQTPAHILSKQAIYSVENITSLLAVLASGVGITVLPKLACPTHLTDLAWIELEEPAIKRHIGMMHLMDRQLSPQAQAFIQTCQQYINTQASLAAFVHKPDKEE